MALSNLIPSNDLTIINSRSEVVASSSTDGSSTDYIIQTYTHQPYLAWIVIATLTLWVFDRIILEFIIRWRR